jgi:hypothetical protein
MSKGDYVTLSLKVSSELRSRVEGVTPGGMPMSVVLRAALEVGLAAIEADRTLLLGDQRPATAPAPRAPKKGGRP